MSYDVALGRMLRRFFNIGDAPLPSPDLTSSKLLAQAVQRGAVRKSSPTVAQMVEAAVPEAVDFVRKYHPSYSGRVLSVKTKI
jgi:hypothetical protein